MIRAGEFVLLHESMASVLSCDISREALTAPVGKKTTKGKVLSTCSVYSPARRKNPPSSSGPTGSRPVPRLR